MKIGKLLTGFFHDEPLSQAYIEYHWLLIGLGRLFFVMPVGRATPSQGWLHEQHEPIRIRDIEDQYKQLRESKLPRDEAYELEAGRRKSNMSNEEKQKEREKRAKRAGKAVSLQARCEYLRNLVGR